MRHVSYFMLKAARARTRHRSPAAFARLDRKLSQNSDSVQRILDRALALGNEKSRLINAADAYFAERLSATSAAHIVGRQAAAALDAVNNTSVIADAVMRVAGCPPPPDEPDAAAVVDGAPPRAPLKPGAAA